MTYSLRLFGWIGRVWKPTTSPLSTAARSRLGASGSPPGKVPDGESGSTVTATFFENATPSAVASDLFIPTESGSTGWEKRSTKSLCFRITGSPPEKDVS